MDKKSVEYKYQLELAKREIEAEFIAKEKAELDAKYADIDIVSLDYWMWGRKQDREEEEIIEKYYQNEKIWPKSEIIDIDKFKNKLQKYKQTKIENKHEYLFIDIFLPEYASIDVILAEYAFIDEKAKFDYSFIDEYETGDEYGYSFIDEDDESFESQNSEIDNLELITQEDIDEWELSLLQYLHGTLMPFIYSWTALQILS